MRFVPENAVTMCDECHDEEYIGSFHHLYGSECNSLDQFIDYYEEETGYAFDYSLLII